MILLYSSHVGKRQSLRGLRSLNPHQGSALDPLGGFTATLDPQLSLATAPRQAIFPFFILGLGFWIISMLGTGIRTPPPPSGPSQNTKWSNFTIPCIAEAPACIS